MTLMLLRRLGMAIPTLLGVSVVIFLLMSVLPGDPLAGLLAQDATPADRAALQRSLGLDAPLAVRYVRWLGDVLHGDFGYSPYRKRDVSELLGTAFLNTVRLAVAAAAFGIGTGLILGTLAAVTRGRVIDRLVSMLAMTGISIPSYWVAILLIIIFSATLKWLPAGGIPSATSAGLQVGFLLGGSVLVETIFSWPGLGQLIFQAIAARDFKVLQAGVLVVSVTFVLVNLLVDVLQLLIDPRL